MEKRFEDGAPDLKPPRIVFRRLAVGLVLRCDRWGLKRVLTDLRWAEENLLVLAQHQEGRELHEDMGYWFPPKLGPRNRQLPKALSVLQANTRELNEKS